MLTVLIRTAPGFDGLEDRFDHGIIKAVAAPTHGRDEAVVPQDLSVVLGAVLAAAVGMVDQAGRRLS